ncbi:phosphatidylinositol-specific phospholipase C1-like protein [Bryobacter aggregatus]|uniref:phosphatidylinositol-specific phospholipase C1-like protein n=1 Tax=Bryobacter aggregatus TaxID=360054 RepID=UPI0004E1A321|nr:phosphatidylinositol-specific phospholipase C1-like protein [Bryobacter aggregatus]
MSNSKQSLYPGEVRCYFIGLIFLAASTSPGQNPIRLRMNEIQIIGSHNSYHSGIEPSQMALIRKANPQAAAALDYRHPSLTQQLNSGVRQLELDVYADPQGAAFAAPAGLARIAKAGLPADPPFDAEPLMKPGFKVLHVKDVDYRSNCQPFIACLEEVRAWSKKHPRHLPIYILIENKDQNPKPGVYFQPDRLSPATFDDLDAEIRKVFRAAEMVTPDDVRGDKRTLEEAILSHGWPSLDSARGKVVFLLDQKRVSELYKVAHRTLSGRVMFTNAEPGNVDAAFVEVNDSQADPELIPRLIRRGYLVRTMTDGGTNREQRRNAAMGSGAQILSTDYPFGWKAANGYHVQFPAGIARCNPVLQVKGCSAAMLKE